MSNWISSANKKMVKKIPEDVIRGMYPKYYVSYPVRARCGCGTVINGKMTDAFHRGVISGMTLMQTVSGLKYSRKTREYVIETDDNYTNNNMDYIKPLKWCCVMSVITPEIVFMGDDQDPQETNPEEEDSQIGFPEELGFLATNIETEKRTPQMELDSTFRNVSLYIEANIPEFTLPIRWDIAKEIRRINL